jgi:hypothetical protein
MGACAGSSGSWEDRRFQHQVVGPTPASGTARSSLEARGPIRAGLQPNKIQERPDSLGPYQYGELFLGVYDTCH